MSSSGLRPSYYFGDYTEGMSVREKQAFIQASTFKGAEIKSALEDTVTGPFNGKNEPKTPLAQAMNEGTSDLVRFLDREFGNSANSRARDESSERCAVDTSLIQPQKLTGYGTQADFGS